MLSSNSIVQNGRFRIIQRIGTIGPSTVYDAFDNLRSVNVIIWETPLTTSKVLTVAEREARGKSLEQNFEFTNHLTNSRVIRNASQFVEVDRHFVVTENVGEPLSAARTTNRLGGDRQVASEIDAWLQMAEEIRTNFPNISNIEITQVSVRVDEMGKPHLLFFGTADRQTNRSNSITDNEADLSFVPLETIWPQLDSASQKAISHNYNDFSLELLESPCDLTADIYSIAAIMFRLASGQAPPNALERSIELLDGGPDPLIGAIERAGFSIELSNFFVRALQIRREDRFARIADARLELNHVMPSRAAQSAADDFDLLELPPVPVVKQSRPFSEPSRVSVIPTIPETKPPATKIPWVEKRVETAPVPPTIAFEKREYLASVPDILDSPVIHEAPVRLAYRETPTPAVKPMFEDAPARSPRLIIAAVVALIIIGVGAFGFIYFKQGTPADTAPQAAIMTETKPEATAAATPALITEQPSAPVSTPSTEMPLQPGREKRAMIADAKQPKKAVEKSDPKSELKRKKAVTVDDLINDN